MRIPFILQKIDNKLFLLTPRLIKKKPKFLMRIFFRTLSRPFLKSKPLRSVLLHPHYICNLHCKHCYEKNFNNTDKIPLSLEEKKKVIGHCLKLGSLSFDFVSGESSLDPEIPELVKACQPDRTYLTLATNGYDLSEEKIRHYLDIGIDKLNISLDSFFPEEHNAIRGKPDSHQNAIKTINLCKKVGMGFHITVFVYKDSTKSTGFTNLVEWAVNNKIRTTFKAAVPLGAWEGKHDSLITDDDRDVMYKLHSKYPFLVRTCIGTSTSTCPAFNRIIAITAYGDVLPCNTVHISFGNVRHEKLRAIIERGRNITYFNASHKGCPPAEDKKFIELYLSKTYNAFPYPIKAESVFKI